jgi:hypothetical protein
MAFNGTPTLMWPGYSSNGTTISINIADLPGLSVADANTLTGDWRAIMLAIISKAYTYYTGLPTADKPAAFVSRAPTIQPVTAGDLINTFKMTYSMDFYNEYCTPDMADEPT